MAEPETAENQEQPQDEPKPEEKKSSSKSGLIFWMIVAAVVIISAGAGLGVGRIVAGKKSESQAQDDDAAPAGQQQQNEIDKLITESAQADSKSWYYPNLDPIVANLNEPGVNRYVRMSLVMEISAAMDQAKGTAFLDEKKPLLVNYLTVYLSSLSVEDVRGEKNLKRIQSQIKDLLNEKLFPNAKPQISSILFKEFSIQ